MNLTSEELQTLERGEPLRIVVAGSRYVVVREDLYDDVADYGEWTKEEIDMLADEAHEIISRGETDEY